ncbi:hypothetical protein BV20DRAFT_547440 [Pilatotrama ljubarskyi]|nr:hypothetical protein BV20DRAFT_547440 [Pilatotrama ljubarskyi]
MQIALTTWLDLAARVSCRACNTHADEDLNNLTAGIAKRPCCSLTGGCAGRNPSGHRGRGWLRLSNSMSMAALGAEVRNQQRRLRFSHHRTQCSRHRLLSPLGPKIASRCKFQNPQVSTAPQRHQYFSSSRHCGHAELYTI